MSSVNELLGHLERRDYLVREPDPDDSRSRRVRLSERCPKLAHRRLALRRQLTDLVDLLDQKTKRVAL